MSVQELVVVLGMHRSGTSTLTRGLQSLGIELGDTLMSATEGINDKGFWEDTEVVFFNEEILYAIDSSWHALAPISEANFAKLRREGYVRRAAEILTRKLSPDHKFGLKDPRISKLLPLWKEAFVLCGADAKYILAVRNPLSVAKSLIKRDGFDAVKCHYIWLEHMLCVLGDPDVRRNAIVVDYDRLLDAPAREIARVATHFGFTVDEDDFSAYTSTFLESGLRHSQYTFANLVEDASCPAIVRDVYSLALKLSSGQPRLDDALTDLAIEEFIAHYNTLTPMLAYTHQVADRLDKVKETLRTSVTDTGDLAVEVEKLRLRTITTEKRLTEVERTSMLNEQYLASAMYELQRIKESTSWRATAPLRYVTRHARNAVVVAKAIPTAVNRQGGIGAALKTSARVFRAEGLTGFKDRLRSTAINIAAEAALSNVYEDDRRPLLVIPRYLDPRYTIQKQDIEFARSIAVHLYVEDEAATDKIVAYLANIPYRFDLFVSTAAPVNPDALRVALTERIRNVSKLNIAPESVSHSGLASLVVNYGRAIQKYQFFAHIYADNTLFAGNASSTLSCIEQMFGTEGSDGREVVQIVRLLADGAPLIYSSPAIKLNEKSSSDESTKWLRHLTGESLFDAASVPVPDLAIFWATTASVASYLECNVDQEAFASLQSLETTVVDETLKLLVSMTALKTERLPLCLYRGDSVDEQRYYEDQIDFSHAISDNTLKVLSYYLPQFHPTPENNEWHGEGFTEWTKVQAANPLFEGHYQQHVPHPDLGYYSLDTPETLVKQAEMMKKAGVFGQIFYHYWFGGRQILEKPALMLRDNPAIDMPYCFCWANENWTRRWDGNEREVLLGQNYSLEDAQAFIQYLIPFFRDSRYIRVNGRPVLMVYRASSIPDCRMYVQAWREECEKAGLPAPYVVAVLTRGATDPNNFDMDAGTERALHDWTDGGAPDIKNSLRLYETFNGKSLDYSDVVDFYMEQNDAKPFTYWRSLVATWDNTARYGSEAYVVHNFTVEKYQRWLEHLVHDAKKRLPTESRFVLINAWNEWAEGAHLEPDTRYGYAYLNSIGRALTGVAYSQVATVTPMALHDVRVRVRCSPAVVDALNQNPRLTEKFLHCLNQSTIFSSARLQFEDALIFEGVKEFHLDTVLSSTGDADFDRLLLVNHVSYFTPDAIAELVRMGLAYPRSIVVANGYGSGGEAAPISENSSVDRARAKESPFVLYPVADHESRSYKLCREARCFVTRPDRCASDDLASVTTILRFHRTGDLRLLENAVLSLLAMYNCNVRPLIAAQDLSEKQKEEVARMLGRYPWHREYLPIVTHYSSADGKGDLRSKMLNNSLKAVTTQYAAFLDYDDLMLPSAYDWLIQRLVHTGKAVAFGRVYVALYDNKLDRIVERRRTFEYGKNYGDFLMHNHAPIHSFMLDVSKLDRESIMYFEDQKYMEDYLLTLQLFSEDNADWDSLNEDCYVGDYIHSVGREHTLAILDGSTRVELLQDEQYLLCQARIDHIRGQKRRVHLATTSNDDKKENSVSRM